MSAIPILKYSAPLHTFSSGNLSYTATKDCYLLGSFPNANNKCDITIDGTLVISNEHLMVGSVRQPKISPIIKIKSGSTITVSVAAPNLHIYEEV